MRKLLRAACIVASIAIATVAVTGCSLFTAMQSGKIPTPAKLANDFCPLVNADLKALTQTTGVLSADQIKQLNDKVIPANTAICAAGAMISVADLKTFDETAFPAIVTLLGTPGIPDGPMIQLALVLAHPILVQAITDLTAPPVTTTPAVPAPASGASAPVAASA